MPTERSTSSTTRTRRTSTARSRTAASTSAASSTGAGAATSASTPRPSAGAQANGARPQLSDVRRPLYASVGAADMAVEKLRALPTTASSEVRRISDKVGELTIEAVKIPTQVGSVVRALPDAVSAQLSDVAGRAAQLYNSWADRGEQRVTGIKRNPATTQAVSRTRTAVSRTKAASTSARRAADAVGKAVGEAATSRPR
ncbi:MAG: hypothetical protein IRZ08_08505 [Frankia sp.]|nr:hypothetical protein [Frankia sp.]